MIELNTILKKAELFEKLAIYGNRKDFLLKISQESSDPMAKYNNSYQEWKLFLDKIYNLNESSDANSELPRPKGRGFERSLSSPD